MALIADKELERDFIQSVLSIGEEYGPGRLNAELAQQTITKDCFTQDWYWEIYRAAGDLSRAGNRLDVTQIAASVGPAGRDAVAAIWPAVPRSTGLGLFCRRLNEFRNRRAAADIGQRIVRAAQEGGDDFSSSLVRAASSLQTSFSSDGSGIENGQDVLLRFYEELERAQGIGGAQTIPTGIQPMDEVTGGIQRNYLSIIGAYPGCFKSGIMATIAANVAASGRRVGFFSLEDNPTWIAKRYVSRATGIPVEALARRRLGRQELEKVAETQDKTAQVSGNIFIDGRSGLSGYDVAASARFMIARHGVELIIIDHTGEMRSRESRKDRYDLEVAENVRAVRDVAKDTGVAVLMAAHLRRKQESEEDIHRVPKMTDFSDSSSIEKMCRLAMGLWQPQDSADQVAIKVLKQNEGGARGTVFYLHKDAKSAMVRND